jgi:hypothetical protein
MSFRASIWSRGKKIFIRLNNYTNNRSEFPKPEYFYAKDNILSKKGSTLTGYNETH